MKAKLEIHLNGVMLSADEVTEAMKGAGPLVVFTPPLVEHELKALKDVMKQGFPDQAFMILPDDFSFGRVKKVPQADGTMEWSLETLEP